MHGERNQLNGILLLIGYEDVVHRLLELFLQLLGNLVDRIAQRMHGAALMLRQGKHLDYGSPESKRIVTDGKSRCLQSAALEVRQHGRPRQLALALTVDDTKHVLFSVLIAANNHQHTRPIIGRAHAAIDAINPDVDEAFIDAALRPRRVQLLPTFNNRAYHGRAHGVESFTNDASECCLHVCRRYTMQITTRRP